MKQEYWLPLFNPTYTQFFGQNYNGSYERDGLLGHSGVDKVTVYGDHVLACQRGLIYFVINKDNPDPMKYRAVCQLIEFEDGVKEIIYGHLNKIFVEPGQFVETGTALGTEGNTGEVYGGGKLITAEEKLAGSTDGFHLHWQKRDVEKVKSNLVAYGDSTKPNRYLSDGNGLFVDKDGYAYLVTNYYNGYNGCSDPMPQCNKVWAGDCIKQLLIISLYKKVVSLLKLLFNAN